MLSHPRGDMGSHTVRPCRPCGMFSGGGGMCCWSCPESWLQTMHQPSQNRELMVEKLLKKTGEGAQEESSSARWLPKQMLGEIRLPGVALSAQNRGAGGDLPKAMDGAWPELAKHQEDIPGCQRRQELQSRGSACSGEGFPQEAAGS